MITADIGQFVLQLLIVGTILRILAIKLAGTPFGNALLFIY